MARVVTAAYTIIVRRIFWLILILLLPSAGCLGPVKGLYPPQIGHTAKTIYVIQRGLHTGVIVRTADVPPNLWPEHRVYPKAQYLEVGWGDSEAYRFPWTTRIVLRALFASKGSVLLLHGFSGSVEKEYAGSAKQIIVVQLSEAGFERLCAFIQASYALDCSGRPIALASEYRGEDFFLARGHYSLINNCNKWTAQALRSAGCPITPFYSVTPSGVMCQTHRFGCLIRPPPNQQSASY